MYIIKQIINTSNIFYLSATDLRVNEVPLVQCTQQDAQKNLQH
jgi:hypothetical protein